MRDEALDPDLLPPSVVELAEAIGLPAALALVRRYGGTRLWVIGEFELAWSVVDLVGEATARQLVARYGGEHLWLPRCAGALRALRDASIRARRTLGEPVDTLAREFGLTDRAVWSIVGRDGAVPDAQGALF